MLAIGQRRVAHQAAYALARCVATCGPPRSVRPVPISVVTVGKGNSRGATLMAEEWVDKLKRWAAGSVCRARLVSPRPPHGP